jgi:hypothetical protein
MARKRITKAVIKAKADERKRALTERMIAAAKKAAEEERRLGKTINGFRVPTVMNEWQTLYQVLNGKSLSRYGDGELKHMEGKRNVSQVWVDTLAAALKAVFRSRMKNHLVAIPNVYSGRYFIDVKEDYVDAMRRRFLRISDNKYIYGSAYVSRGDMNGYMQWASYWGVVSELWRGRDVVLVRGVARRAAPDGMMLQARNIAHVETPSVGAWEKYPSIFKECLKHAKSSIFLLCVGPTATVLAADLAQNGRWAVDIGHLGLFYKKWGIEFDYNPQVWHHRPTDPGYKPGNPY